MRIEDRLKELDINLPECPQPAAVYVPATISDNLVFVAGQTPKDGKTLLYKGKLGKDLTIDEGYSAAQVCILRGISAVKSLIGDLDRVEQILKITGYVNCTDEFDKQSIVINGASELVEKIFGDRGKHARVAIGTNSLPGNAAVEVELIVKVKKMHNKDIEPLKELIESGFGKEEGLNCAEKILHGANRVYNLNLNDEALKLAYGFGGGMGIQSVCGVLTGGVMVISKVCKDKNTDKNLVKDFSNRFFDMFREEMEDVNCHILKDIHHTEDLGCHSVIVKAAEILDKLVAPLL